MENIKKKWHKYRPKHTEIAYFKNPFIKHPHPKGCGYLRIEKMEKKTKIIIILLIAIVATLGVYIYYPRYYINGIVHYGRYTNAPPANISQIPEWVQQFNTEIGQTLYNIV